MKTNNPVFAYGLIFTSVAWAIAAIIIGIRYQQKSFLIISFLAVLALLSAISGVIVLSRLAKRIDLLSDKRFPSDTRIASLIHLCGLLGYIIPLANILVTYWLWNKHQHKSRFIYDSGLQAVNFQLTCGVYFLSALMLCALFIGFIILPAIIVYHVFFILVAIYVTRRNKLYHYPGNLNFIANQLDSKNST